MSDELESAKRWVAEVEAAYADGGYAAGDGPAAPLDEMRWLLGAAASLARARAALHSLHFSRNGYCNECGGQHPCLTLRLLTEEPDRD